MCSFLSYNLPDIRNSYVNWGWIWLVTIQRWREHYFGPCFDFIGRAGKAGWITGPLLDLSKVAGVAGWLFIFFAAALVSVGVDFDLEKIDTRDWGGLSNYISSGDNSYRCVSTFGYFAGSWSPLRICLLRNILIHNIYRVLARCAP